ncbi:hypothetical protein OCK02_24295 [Rhizobium sp. TRM96647]|jgi:hypothetical protein|uniref:DUF6894 family protein n=1 Tax=unclassified Rhizobium TaxID=2613769 RepID=UPI0021E8BAEE|nr:MULTISPECIES: hypothetical protein [unclassified Rhizobium]MCV3739294.1 hypothetical protein [Rhizobium sp. TRM96647]MCV3760956.1 hypothetical protein [Rhizobium sp. TRM96650]
MSRYYFHVRTTDGVETDHEGIEFEDVQAAEVDARASLFEMMADDLAAGRKTKFLSIEIADGLGTLIVVVDARDAVNGRSM